MINETDGQPGNMTDGKHLIKVIPKLTGVFVSVTKTMMDQYTRNISEETASGNHFKYRTELGSVDPSEYKNNVSFITKRNDGKKVIYVLANAITESGVDVSLNDAEQSEFTVEYMGSFTSTEFRELDTPLKSPLAIYIPVESVKTLPVGTINTLTPDETEVSADISIIDGESAIIGKARVDIEETANLGVVISTENLTIVDGTENIVVNGLITGTDYTMFLRCNYDLDDGAGVITDNELASETFTTL